VDTELDRDHPFGLKAFGKSVESRIPDLDGSDRSTATARVLGRAEGQQSPEEGGSPGPGHPHNPHIHAAAG
jgi:hypothetical protein